MAEKKKVEKNSVESMLSRLEEIVRLLEKGDQPLDGSLALYEEGCGLVRECMKSLENAEQIVMKWQKTAEGTPVETPFTVSEE